MKAINKYINGGLSLLLLVYYLFLSWVIHRTSYEHPESVFIAEKLKVLIETPDNRLHILGTTYPTLVFLSSFLFTPFGYLFAPVVASIVITTFLFFLVLNDFRDAGKLPAYVYLPALALLFMFHPGLMYTAISGRGVAAVLLFFYLLFRSLLKYYQTQTTFHISMASLYMCCLIFCNYNFIWLLLAFFPFIVLISLDGLKVDRDQPSILQYYETVNNVSLRRKLTNRTLAIYGILFLLPLAALLLFRLLNEAHAGDASYFLTSQYANWHVIGDVPVGDLIAKGVTDNAGEQVQMVFQVYVLLLNPILILAFIYFRGRVYELFTLLSPFILMSILLIHLQTYFTIEYYLIFLVTGLAGLVFYASPRFNRKLTWFLVFTVALLNIAAGIFYFHHTKDAEERYFFSALRNYKNWIREKRTTEESSVAAFISSVTDRNNRILIDDAAAFEIIAHMHSLDVAVLSESKNFITAAENPKSVVTYLCIAKDNNDKRNFTVLNNFNLQKMVARKQFEVELMYQSDHWAVYRIL